MDEKQRSIKKINGKENWFITHLAGIMAIIMIASLCFGPFIDIKNNIFSDGNVPIGLAFVFDNREFKAAWLLLACPLILLIVGFIKKPSIKVVRLILAIVSLIIFFVTKSEVSAEFADDIALSAIIGSSGMIYIVANIVSIVATGAAYRNIDLVKVFSHVTSK
ncbi:hypothetical protein [Loigolactobacillus bifermentans]|uniref:Uncharacterized protein n=1 Tax=Loigolactobacillus bifermentans DSM 20003 TaxID=1423726 RepID=A0A0R1H0Y4_9LACO|nr:hypothetical protein [Loigolactobacillus bifermentans]KRK39912.1 hypothetical protein FC07_GL002159 [Loigolactobacillus bifermentans DSM 20003]QGG61344.1 hypothetical protein LB003_13175 [Loigolactobacillus bifermentans]